LVLFATDFANVNYKEELPKKRYLLNKPSDSSRPEDIMATETKMKALHYDGPFKVSVKEIDLPKIEHPDDVIIKVTTAAICGSDLQ
jgi:hypothetical protein